MTIKELPPFLDIKGVLENFPITERMAYEAVESGWWPNWKKPGKVQIVRGRRVYRDGKRWMGPTADIVAWFKKFDGAILTTGGAA